MSVKRLRLYEFTLRGRDFESVVRIRESLYYRGFLLKKIYENFIGTLELSVIERCPYRGVRLYFSSVIPVLKRFDFLYKLKSVVTNTTKEMN